ncbi:hypothetical protein VP01_3791g3 [Puccinia sorghi]|uniref:Uncharacterized protein n=1 Tax=Puccinia sorghi TaxID=27349 RepID=A0A0L6UTI0_9BASI|nr:hypothetical protein VP01_3791g3 [Puccinia sorghi]
MADTPLPGWTSRPSEWAVLRDQIAATSKPTLSDSIRLSFYILIALCSISTIVHLYAVVLRLRRSTPSSPNRLFDTTVLGHHQPDLTLILPIIFSSNALLNLASLSSLLSDANRLKFKGYTMAIQQFNFSLLLSAGILLAWALVCGLPPMRVGICGVPRSRWSEGITIPTILPRRAIKPWWLHVVGYSSLALVFLVPLPCIILSMRSIEDINHLDAQLLVTVNHVLEDVSPQPAGDPITNTLQTIQKLDQAASYLFTHLRMLSAIHLFLTLAILASCIWVSLEIIRPLLKQAPLMPSSTYSMNEHPTHSFHHPNDLTYKTHQLTHLAEPKPAVIANPHKTRSEQRSIDYMNHSKDHDLQNFDDKRTSQTKRSTCSNPTGTFTSETYLVPSVDNHHYPEPQAESQQQSSLSNYIKKLKSILILTGACATGFMILNFCIMINTFDYPDNNSIGDLLIMKLEWSTWLWNGSISPLIGLMNCSLLLNKGRAFKKFAIRW